jgi:hypothetical protein
MDDSTNENTPVDFSAFGPPITADRLEALVAAAVRGGGEELRRRRSGAAVVRVVVAWRRPLLVLSGLAAAAAIALIERPVAIATSEPAVDNSIAEALGVPPAYAESVEGRAHGAATATSEKP